MNWRAPPLGRFLDGREKSLSSAVHHLNFIVVLNLRPKSLRYLLRSDYWSIIFLVAYNCMFNSSTLITHQHEDNPLFTKWQNFKAKFWKQLPLKLQSWQRNCWLSDHSKVPSPLTYWWRDLSCKPRFSGVSGSKQGSRCDTQSCMYVTALKHLV